MLYIEYQLEQILSVITSLVGLGFHRLRPIVALLVLIVSLLIGFHLHCCSSIVPRLILVRHLLMGFSLHRFSSAVSLLISLRDHMLSSVVFRLCVPNIGIESAAIYPPCQTHWLVRKNVQKALQRGTISLIRQSSSMIEFKVEQVIIGDEKPVDVIGANALLRDHSRQGIEKVDARLAGSHARFCRSIQLVNIARAMTHSPFHEAPTLTDTPRQPLPVHISSSRLGLGHTFLRPMTHL